MDRPEWEGGWYLNTFQVLTEKAVKKICGHHLHREFFIYERDEIEKWMREHRPAALEKYQAALKTCARLWREGSPETEKKKEFRAAVQMEYEAVIWATDEYHKHLARLRAEERKPPQQELSIAGTRRYA